MSDVDEVDQGGGPFAPAGWFDSIFDALQQRGIVDGAGYLPCGCHGSQRDHSCRDEVTRPALTDADRPARWSAHDAVARVLSLHTRATGPAGESYCEHCHSLCHSRSGLNCEDPLDGLWPCPTVEAIAGRKAAPRATQRPEPARPEVAPSNGYGLYLVSRYGRTIPREGA